MYLDDQRLYDPLSPLEQLEERLKIREASFWDDHVSASDIRMVPETGQLAISRDIIREYDLQPQAFDQIAMRLKIPASYLTRCPSELRAQNVNHWLASLRNKLLQLRFDGQAVRAILTPQYVPVSNYELVQNLREVMSARGIQLRVRFEWTPSRFVAQLVEQSRDLSGVGDTMLQGLHIINSETGHASLSLSAMLYRLICTNGMTLQDQVSFSRTHRRDVRSLSEDLQEMFSGVWNRLPEFVEPIRYLESRLLQDPFEEEMGKLARAHKLSDEAQASLMQAWELEPGATQIFLLHALTRAGNDPNLPLDERTELQHIGGLLLRRSD